MLSIRLAASGALGSNRRIRRVRDFIAQAFAELPGA